MITKISNHDNNYTSQAIMTMPYIRKWATTIFLVWQLTASSSIWAASLFIRTQFVLLWLEKQSLRFSDSAKKQDTKNPETWIHLQIS